MQIRATEIQKLQAIQGSKEIVGQDLQWISGKGKTPKAMQRPEGMRRNTADALVAQAQIFDAESTGHVTVCKLLGTTDLRAVTGKAAIDSLVVGVGLARQHQVGDEKQQTWRIPSTP